MTDYFSLFHAHTHNEQLTNTPSRRHAALLGRLLTFEQLSMTTDLTPTIIIDSREQAPLPIKAYPTMVAGLTSGDYSVRGLESLFSVERKSIADLVQSLTTERERFMRELERLRGYRFARLLVIGWPGQIEQGQYRSRTAPKAIMHSLFSLEAKYVPVVWARTPADGAELVERWAFWFARSIAQAAESLLAKE